MIKPLLHCLMVGTMLAYAPTASAVEWTKISENSVKDKFFVDQSSIQHNGPIVWFWEYREFPQANNAFLETKVDQPVHGAVIRWSVDCTNKAQRLRKVNAYTKNRKLIQKFEYGNNGTLSQPKPGSSAYAIVDYVCTPKDQAKPTLP